MAKRNEEYYALKARIDKWGVWVLLVYPFFSGVILVFGGASLGQRLLPTSGVPIGFFVGGPIWLASVLYLFKKKFGFIMNSAEKCQNYGIAMARNNDGVILQDYICRKCGNNNSVDLNSLNSNN
ncbi:hypothetical protein N9W89_07095 [Hellea sp.]|nr:hypothetical protein [Hellea sp.]